MTSRLRFALVVVVALGATHVARAQDGERIATPDDKNRARADKLRAELANQLHLQANGLLDELVFAWKETPPFTTPTPVVLADVIAPLGYGSGLEALIENHLAQLLQNNPTTNVRLAHCPACNAVVVHSDAQGTVIARGVDQPDAIARMRGGSGVEHALFIDFEAEGSALVLRARITKLVDGLPIVHARTLSTHTSAATLLQSPNRLRSADEVREEYKAILDQRGPITFPFRLAMNAFAPAEDSALTIPLPVPWLQVGAEYAISSARAWTGSVMFGATYLPTIQTGFMAQARVARLVGSEVSLTYPNIYLFLGTALALLQGQTATILNPPPQPDPEDPPPLFDIPIFGPTASYFSVQAGVELRVSQRIGISVFAETMPPFWESETVGNWLNQVEAFDGMEFGIFTANTVGAEATFLF